MDFKEALIELLKMFKDKIDSEGGINMTLLFDEEPNYMFTIAIEPKGTEQ